MDSAPRPSAIIIFDGSCNLCNRAVQFIITRDQKHYFYFANLQTKMWGKVLSEGNYVGEADTVLLFENGKLYIKSTAVLRILRKLRFPWSLFYGLHILPVPARDWMYDKMATYRSVWFDKAVTCWVAENSDAKSLFLK